MSRLARGASYALVLVVCVELAVWGAFLTGSRPFGHALPLAALTALVGNLAVGFAGARVLGRPLGAALPGALWLVVALALAVRTGAGSLVVTGTARGWSFLAVGAIGAAVPIGLSAPRAAVRATPEGQDGR